MKIVRYLPEILTAVSATLGYALVVWTAGVLLTEWLWPLGGGLYLLALSGFRLVGVVVWQGLYTLSVDEEEDRG